METGLLAALVFAAAIVLLAIVLTRLVRPRRRGDGDRERTSDAVAKSIAITRVREDGHD